MAQDTATILKELSVLSSNMDALVRELKEQNKTTAENTKGINNLVAQIKENPSPKNQKPVEQNESPTKLFENLVSSFSKEISKSNEILQKNLDKQMGSSLKDLAKSVLKPAEVKPNPNFDFFKALGLDKLPQLKDGGEIQKDGVAIVGEEGPEIVKLKKDQKVISKQENLYKLELEEIQRQEKLRLERNNKLEKEMQEMQILALQELFDVDKKYLTEEDKSRWQYLNTKPEENIPGNPTISDQNIITQKPGLENSIRNKNGVIVPKTEIDKEKQNLEKDPYYKKFPEELQEELDYFIESYEESPEEFSPSSISALSKTVKPETQQVLQTENKTSKNLENKRDKKNQKSTISPTQPKLLESLKSKGKEFGSNLKQSISSKVDEAKQTLSGKNTPNELETYASISQQMQKLSKDMSESMEMKKETPTLKKAAEGEKSKPKSTSAPSLPQQQDIQSVTPKVAETQTTPSKIQENKKEKKETGETLPHQEIKDIKALLAGIYKALSGPLRIANDAPFRPNSNII